jgi:hypothetical protein
MGVAELRPDSHKGIVIDYQTPVPQTINSVAEFYASGLFLVRNNLANNQTEHDIVVLAAKKLAEFRILLGVLLS